MTKLEELAQIIDPDAWRWREYHLARAEYWDGCPEVAGADDRVDDHRRDADFHAKPSLDKARAVLTALREPDEGMILILAGQRLGGKVHVLSDEWRALIRKGHGELIDHILQEADRD